MGDKRKICPQAVGKPVDRDCEIFLDLEVFVVVEDGLLPNRVGRCERDPCEEDQDGRDEEELADVGDSACFVDHVDHDGDAVGADGQNDQGEKISEELDHWFGSFC